MSDEHPPPPPELPHRLTACRIRATHFPTRRRGFDPDAVHAFLHLVADEMLRLHQRIAHAYSETDRIKRHLKQWQTDHTATCRTAEPRTHAGPPNAPAPAHWPAQPPYPPARDN